MIIMIKYLFERVSIISFNKEGGVLLPGAPNFVSIILIFYQLAIVKLDQL